ncbi:MAG: Gfo/Idh/MocA family oxidoreductase, partial [Actinomycetota bacterium]
MSRSTLRLGIIGTGMMGCEHIRNVMALDGAEVTAISDPHRPSLDVALLTLVDHAAPRIHSDHRELLDAGDLDGVIVASPNHTHVDVLRDV